jgi:hypothetical protein
VDSIRARDSSAPPGPARPGRSAVVSVPARTGC